jgi:hypothetical protein
MDCDTPLSAAAYDIAHHKVSIMMPSGDQLHDGGPALPFVQLVSDQSGVAKCTETSWAPLFLDRVILWFQAPSWEHASSRTRMKLNVKLTTHEIIQPKFNIDGYL